MNKTLFCLALAVAASITSASAQSKLIPLAGFGANGDGTIRPGDYPFLTSDGNRYQRCMAFNPTTGHLIVVNRFPRGSETINVIDALTGAYIGELDQSWRTFGGLASFVYNCVAVAEDGAIYVGNLTTSATTVEFILYRWADEASMQSVVYGPGNPAGEIGSSTRWGDTLTVRGAGLDTEILISNRGNQMALLRPTDASLTFFSATPINVAVPSTQIGYALAFGPGNTCWNKATSEQGSTSYYLGFDAIAGSATPLLSINNAGFPMRVGALASQLASNWLAAVEFTSGADPDLIRLYDISNPAQTPAYLDRQPVAVWTNNNSVYAGSITFGYSTNLYALNGDNGIAAYTITPGEEPREPYIFGQPASIATYISSNATLRVGADGSATLAYQWLKNSTNIPGATAASLTFTNCDTTDTAKYTVVVTNNFGALTSAVAVLTIIPNIGNATVWDPFDYPPGSKLAGQGGWVLKSTVENGEIEEGSLTVPGLWPARGNRYTWTANNSVRWVFSPDKTNGAIYFSFALRMGLGASSVANETVAGLVLGTEGSTFPMKINVMAAAGTPRRYQIGVYKGTGTANGSLAPDWFTEEDTVFIVGRYTFRPEKTNDDSCDLWVNPAPETFGELEPPAPTLADQGAGSADFASLNGFFWRYGSGYPKRTTDEFRLGFTWADVTPPAQPQIKATLAGANVIISWPSQTPPSFALQSIRGLDDQDGWQWESTPVVLQGDRHTVTLPAGEQVRFFRLKK